MVKDRLKYFETELNRFIKNSFRLFTEQVLLAAPSYIFENCPASSSGKYHPKDELDWDGTLRHTKKIAKMSLEIARGLNLSQKYYDHVLCAAICHDLVKQGITDEDIAKNHTVKYHAELAVELCKYVYNEPMENFSERIPYTDFVLITDAIRRHAGPWNNDEKDKDVMKFNQIELAVYMADYVVSRRFIQTEID